MAQLDLSLDDARVRIPWDGKRPRDLTRIRIALFLRREPQKACAIWIDPRQCEMWRTANNRPQVLYLGAPLLVEVEHDVPQEGRSAGRSQEKGIRWQDLEVDW